MQNININRPTDQMNAQPQQPMRYGNSSSRMPWVILAVVVIIALAVLAYVFRDKIKSTASNNSGYQAVFLTNGQVYFGKLSDVNGDYVTLKDIYYLQVNQSLQSSGQNSSSQQQQQPQLSLVKLGNELHGPADTMEINRQQVLFYEDIKKDGKVAQAIAQYQANPTAAAPAAATPASSTTTQTTVQPAPASK